MKYKAIIFDFDGLMFDTEAIWKHYFFEANKKFNLSFSEQDRQKCIGRNEQEIRKMLKSIIKDCDVDAYRDWMRLKTFNHIDTIGVQAKSGLKEVIDFCKTNQMQMAIASGSEKNRILKSLSDENISSDDFKVIASGDMKINPKPNPDIYLYVCKQLDLDPSQCIVLEDSYLGVEAGHNAGCFTIMIPDTLPANNHMKKTADLILNNLNQVVDFLKQQN
ncbi:MAG: HAD family phosphatase [Clostridia bacterium]|nr:HAD family phosphatase [Clostridia bacterium]